MSSNSYDFVVVGGGIAGLVVANRLSEDPNKSVIILEAGNDYREDPRVQTPGFYPVLLGSELDWGFQSEPQVCMLDQEKAGISQGKAVGGSSAINAHVFVPPSKKLTDAWGRLGNDGWDWNTLQQYFSKSYTSPSISSGEDLGVNEWESINDLAKGPVQASFSGNVSHPIRKAWHETFKALGHVAETDPFLGISTGAFTCLSSIDPATRARSFAASTYYQAVQDRDNLKLLTGAVVEKILFDEAGPTPRAKWVRYSNENATHEILAKKEVILAAGALQSPKILESSGIGDKTLLEVHGINLVKDVPALAADHRWTGFRR